MAVIPEKEGGMCHARSLIIFMHYQQTSLLSMTSFFTLTHNNRLLCEDKGLSTSRLVDQARPVVSDVGLVRVDVSILVLGLGTGTATNYFLSVAPNAVVHTVEINKGIIEVMRCEARVDSQH